MSYLGERDSVFYGSRGGKRGVRDRKAGEGQRDADLGLPVCLNSNDLACQRAALKGIIF